MEKKRDVETQGADGRMWGLKGEFCTGGIEGPLVTMKEKSCGPDREKVHMT